MGSYYIEVIQCEPGSSSSAEKSEQDSGDTDNSSPQNTDYGRKCSGKEDQCSGPRRLEDQLKKMGGGPKASAAKTKPSSKYSIPQDHVATSFLPDC